ncbi:MAG: aminodeoxychorismate/anthranilate synthase component II [Oscillospiraceae bacterium]|nr:aminodeoxychorismate/anthranilate synthase component II [Oscillospiraceae bacterium]
MTLIIDNYDSFTYNLAQCVGALNPELLVRRNDEITVADIRALNPAHIILSPGPGHPKDAGVCEEVILALRGEIPILGVCLGHQAICEAYGCTVSHAKELMHGKASCIHVAGGSPIFRGLPPLIAAARYHSLAAVRATLPDDLLVIAEDGEGEIMAVKARGCDVYGLQFHPESILTPHGAQIIENFMSIGGVSA